jgi:hypothetical protein
MVSEHLHNKIIDVQYINIRITKVSVLIGVEVIDIIQIYAPQMGCDEDVIEDFIRNLTDC